MAILLAAMKLVLLSTAVLLSANVMLNMSVASNMVEFALSEFPSIYSKILSWLQPPYLYILINAIILSIVASSKLQKNTAPAVTAEPRVSQVPPPLPIKAAYDEYNGMVRSSDESIYYDTTVANKVHEHDVLSSNESVYFDAVRDDVVSDSSGSEVCDGVADEEVEKVVMDSEDDVKAQDTSRWTSPQWEDFLMNENYEKPPLSSRLSGRKIIKGTPEGKSAVGVTKPRRRDTLETTWRTITEGRAMPLTRQLKKSETWDTHQQKREDCTVPTMKKAETFNKGNGSGKPPLSRSSGKVMSMRREPSLSQDELNRRVEEFIKKFNEDMRLQRQKSLDQYREMDSHGAVAI